nr:protein Daple [Crassostrea gigas]
MRRNSRRWPWPTYKRNSISRGRISDPLSLVTRLDSSSSAQQWNKRKPNGMTFRAIERVRTVNHKLRESLDSERYSLLESADQKIPIFENMQLELESERAKVKDLKNSVEREKQRLQSQVTALESQTSVLKDELEQERLVCRQMKNEIDQIQLQKLDATRHYEHESDQVSQLKCEHELLRSQVKSLKLHKREGEKSRHGGSDRAPVTETAGEGEGRPENEDDAQDATFWMVLSLFVNMWNPRVLRGVVSLVKDQQWRINNAGCCFFTNGAPTDSQSSNAEFP